PPRTTASPASTPSTPGCGAARPVSRIPHPTRATLGLGAIAALLSAAIGITAAVGAGGVFGDEVRLTDARLLAVGDLGGTPRPDLVFGQGAGIDVVTVAVQQPDGTFVSGPPLTGVRNPTAAAVADFTGDGRPDLAALGDGGGLLLAGAADGSLTPRQALSTSPDRVTSAAAGDV